MSGKSKGHSVAVNNTPQARDDSYATNEDAGTLHLLDVLENDLGGKARALWSVRQQDPAIPGDERTVQSDVLEWQTLDSGARIAITADGRIAYDLSGLTATIEALGAGDAWTDTFTYSIRMANGAISVATATITVTGTNDAPTVTSAVQSANPIEIADGAAGENATTHVASGAITFSDADTGDLHQASVVAQGTDYRGTFTLGALDQDGNAVGWAFSIDDAALDDLAAGETLSQVYLVTIADGHGGSTSQSVTVTLTGTNDAPVIEARAGDSAGAVLAEQAGSPAASGTLSVSDADLSDQVALAVTGVTVAEGSAGPLTEAQLLSFLTLDAVALAADPGAAGNLGWSFDPAGATFDHLASGETLRLQYSVEATDGSGAAGVGVVTIVIAGSNDAPVITSPSPTVMLTEIADGAPGENVATLTADGAISFSDLDASDTHTATVTAQGAGYLDTLSLGAVDPSTGTVAWTFEVTDGALDGLADGQTIVQAYDVTIDDGQGGSAVQTIEVVLTGTNDGPRIVAGADAGAVREDGPATASGTLVAADPDAGAVLAWSVAGGSPARTADYTFSLDNFRIEKNGNAFFEDGFEDGAAPPQSPDFPGGLPTTYTMAGAMSEADGRVVLDSDQAVPVQGVGTNDPFIGQLARVRSDINPNDLARGLKIDDDFVVEGRFDLVIPDATREYYGIRLTDRLIGGSGTPPDQPGDDVIELIVRQGADGINRIQLRELDFAADTVTNIQGLPLTPPPGADQVVLRLAHEASTGVLTASFDYLDDGAVVSTLTLLQTARIFGTETPTYAGDNETWTRAEFIAASPQVVSSSQAGTYGTLFVEQNGTWTYALANGSAAVQQLAAGQTAVDTFTVTVADEHGTTDTRTVSVTVTGANDAPVVVTPDSTRSFGEDAAPTLSASGLGAFTDVDLADSHAITAALQGATLSSGAALSTALAGVLGNALTATLTQAAQGSGSGTYQWDFALASSAVQMLASGETLTATYQVTVRDNHGGQASQSVTINVVGANDAPTVTTTAGATPQSAVMVAENTAGAFLTLAADDPESQAVTFSIGANPDGSFDNGFFTVDAATGALAFAAPPDFEFTDPGNDDLYKVRVTATDSQGASDIRDIFVRVTDVDEAIDVVGTQHIDFALVAGPIGSYAGFDWQATGSFYHVLADWYGTGNAVYNGWAGKQSTMARVDGSDFSVDRLDIWQQSGVTSVDFVGFHDGVEVYRQSHSVTPSPTTVELDFAGIDRFEVTVTDSAYSGNGVQDTGWWFIDNIWIA